MSSLAEQVKLLLKHKILINGYCNQSKVKLRFYEYLPLHVVYLILYFYSSILIYNNTYQRQTIKLFEYMVNDINHFISFQFTQLNFINKLAIGTIVDNAMIILPTEKIIYNHSFNGILCTDSGICAYKNGKYQYKIIKKNKKCLQIKSTDFITIRHYIYTTKKKDLFIEKSWDEFVIFFNDKIIYQLTYEPISPSANIYVCLFSSNDSLLLIDSKQGKDNHIDHDETIE